MKNVYFVQVDVSATIGEPSAYLPYTAGILAAAAWESTVVKENLQFRDFIFLREAVADVTARIEEPFIVAFSNYCWNTEYNKRLAEAIKEKWPDCVTVFGGHNVPDDFSFLEDFPYIDILCHGEGEETVRHLFEALALNEPLDSVNNISFRKNGGYVRTASSCPGAIENYPSPYLDGWFDKLLEEHPDIAFNAILETSRGCPNKCAYCDWGLLQSKVRQFSLERVKAEIKWFADHKIVFVWGADANFGMFSRDLEIAQALVDAKEATGYPERMRMNYAKNNFENVFAIVKKFKECDFDRMGATLSFQSLSPTVLENIGRTNADIDFYKNLLTKYNTEKMKAYSELILALPGETYESFTQGIGKLFEIGQHFVFAVYECILLPNARLGQKETIAKHGIEAVRTEIIRPHFENAASEIPEYNVIITQTDTMPRAMWVRSSVFYNFAKTFHGNGMLRAFAIYLHYHLNVPYEKFYDGILNYCEERPELMISALYREIKEDLEEQSLGTGHRKLRFAPTGDVIWDDHEYLVLRILNEPDRFYADMLPYLKSFGIPEDIFNDLLAYQRGILRLPKEARREIKMNYDVHGFLTDAYINDVHPLMPKKHTLIMKDSDTMQDWPTFGKYVVWYGKMGLGSYKDDVEIIEEDPGLHKKKKVYYVQVPVTFSSPAFLPYSVGCLAAYLKADPEITEYYEIPDIIIMREKIEDALKRFDDPYIVAFSCFTWNLEYSKTLARKLKSLYPDVKIIFGGHSVPHNGSFLDEYPYVDYLMHNEGEESTAAFLKALINGTPLEDVPNLSFRGKDGTVTTRDYYPCDLSSYPSPYLTGIFDSVLKEFPDVEFHATIETNRGCPYSCAFCEWCYTKKIRPLPMERIKAEIDWLGKNKIRYCYCADANFGILDRDIEIAQYIVDTNKKYGYPEIFKPCYAKESDDNVFEAGYLLNKNNIDKGVTLAYQSLDSTTLNNIGRSNLTLERFSSIYRRYTEAGIPTYTELILGLPGETRESFCRGICELLKAGQNNSMTVYECQVYPHTLVGDPDYQKKYGIKTARIPLFGIHYNPEFSGVNEFVEIIYETSSMPKDDWVDSYMFSVLLQTFHHLGLLRYFAIYLHKENGVDYYDFYNALYDFIRHEANGFTHDLFEDLIRRKHDLQTADWTYQKDEFSSTGWYFEEGAFLELASHFEEFKAEIDPFLQSFGIEEDLLAELKNYQYSLIRQLDTDEVTVSSLYNFYAFFEDQTDAVKLTKKHSVLHIRSDSRYSNWADYAQHAIWFGKRYSATLMLNPKEHITYSEE